VRDIALYWEARDDISSMHIRKQNPMALLVKVCRKGGKALGSELGKSLSLDYFEL
jgi:hypothetical protein